MYGLSLAKPRNNGPESARSELLRLLSDVTRDREPPIIIIDGLDKAERVRARQPERDSIIDWLPEPLQPPGHSRWVLSSRPEMRSDPIPRGKR